MILITTYLLHGCEPYLCFDVFTFVSTFLSTYLSSVCTFSTLLFCNSRSGMKQGSLMCLHAYPNASISRNILPMYSAGINSWMSASEAYLTWPVGSWRSYYLSLITLQIWQLGIYFISQVWFLWFFKGSRSLTLNFGGYFVFLIGYLSLTLVRFRAHNMKDSLKISINRKTCLLNIIIWVVIG